MLDEIEQMKQRVTERDTKKNVSHPFVRFLLSLYFNPKTSLLS